MNARCQQHKTTLLTLPLFCLAVGKQGALADERCSVPNGEDSEGSPANRNICDRLPEEGVSYVRERITSDGRAQIVTEALCWVTRRGPKARSPAGETQWNHKVGLECETAFGTDAEHGCQSQGRRSNRRFESFPCPPISIEAAPQTEDD